MFTLHSIAVMIGGDLDKGLAMIFAELGRIRTEVPDASAQADRLQAWLSAQTAGQWTEAALTAIAAQIIGLVSGSGWGPPNPGSIAGAPG